MAASVTLLLATLCLIIGKTGCQPKKCYTCSSALENKVCGEKFKPDSYFTKVCHVNYPYCLKLIESVFRTPFMYRKCTNNSCEEEKSLRQGDVTYCSVCTKTLCNVASIIGPSSILALCAFLVIYQQTVLGD